MSTTDTKLRLPAQAAKTLEKAAEEINEAPALAALTPVEPAKTPEEVIQSPANLGLAFPTYQAERLTQFMLHDGTVIKPVDGIYTATTEEMFDALNYYARQDSGLVTPLF